MAHTEKQKLQKARAWFKFVLTGLIKPVKEEYLSDAELELWESIKANRNTLISIHDNVSRQNGLNVPKNRCYICRKEATCQITSFGETYNLCDKHYKEEKK